jgi:hypothetical protein
MLWRSTLKTLITFAVGFGTGWAVRSIADSPHGVGVKVMEVAYRTKGQLSRWFAIERERISDMMAEARSKAQPEDSLEKPTSIKNAA